MEKVGIQIDANPALESAFRASICFKWSQSQLLNFPLLLEGWQPKI
jgi:hypothetical protein